MENFNYLFCLISSLTFIFLRPLLKLILVEFRHGMQFWLNSKASLRCEKKNISQLLVVSLWLSQSCPLCPSIYFLFTWHLRLWRRQTLIFRDHFCGFAKKIIGESIELRGTLFVSQNLKVGWELRRLSC